MEHDENNGNGNGPGNGNGNGPVGPFMNGFFGDGGLPPGLEDLPPGLASVLAAMENEGEDGGSETGGSSP